MNPIAIEQAKERLQKAERSLQSLRIAENFEAAEEAWADFLIAAAAVYSKLEQGAKHFGASQGWYGRKKEERRDDPVLRYLHLARNCNEHGLERVVRRYHDTGPIWGKQPAFGERVPVTLQAVDGDGNPIGEPTEGFYSGSTIKLVRVRDSRYGNICDPPQSHLGNKIPYFEEPLDVAELGAAYLRTLVADAEKLLP